MPWWWWESFQCARQRSARKKTKEGLDGGGEKTKMQMKAAWGAVGMDRRVMR